jgi:hypothetical protein
MKVLIRLYCSDLEEAYGEDLCCTSCHYEWDEGYNYPCEISPPDKSGFIPINSRIEAIVCCAWLKFDSKERLIERSRLTRQQWAKAIRIRRGINRR